MHNPNDAAIPEESGNLVTTSSWPLAVSAPSLNDAQGATERVVLVDDNSNIRRLARELLEELGYQVEAYANGQQALAAIARDSRPIALLVTDFTMPELTGYQLARKIREERPGLPILIVSGLSEDTVMPASLEPAFPFLQKPYSLKSLARKIREILDVETPAPVSGFMQVQQDLTG